jgi:GTP-dependent phosphoenolpyruvate carboxykinase
MKGEIPDIQAHFDQFGDRLPGRLTRELKKLVERLERS